jgi:hypothetical protein
MSNRFAMKRFLGLTAEEIAENETMWKEENIDEDTSLSASAELRSTGVTANDMSTDLSNLSGGGAQPPVPAEGEAMDPNAAPPESSPTPTP